MEVCELQLAHQFEQLSGIDLARIEQMDRITERDPTQARQTSAEREGPELTRPT
jgi:hypothetical protein